MATELTQEVKDGFIPLTDEIYQQREKLGRAIARLIEKGDRENKNWKIMHHSGKHFYCSSAEVIVLQKQTNTLFLGTQCTNHFGRNGWQSPDYFNMHKMKQL